MCYNRHMAIEISGISKYAERSACLAAERGSGAYIHSVYERTVNIMTENSGMISIQKESSPVSPLTLLIDDSAPLFLDDEVRPGAPVRFSLAEFPALSGNRIESIGFCGHSLCIPVSAPRFETDIPYAEKPSEDYLLFYNRVREHLSGLPSNSGPVYDVSERIKLGSSALYADGGYEEAAEKLISLTGLGNGLTPSGDDFLTGIITGIYSSCNEEHPFSKALLGPLRDALDRTNDISAAFISAALDRHTSLPLKHFIENPSSGSIAEISEIGHSSGFDALEGFLYYRDLIK